MADATDARIDQAQAAIEARADTAGGATRVAIGDPAGSKENLPGIGWQEPGQSWTVPNGLFRALLAGLLDSLDMPVGTVLPFVGALASLPASWQAADGTNGTTDLRGAYLRGAIGSPPAIGAPDILTDGAGSGVVKEAIWIQKVLVV